MNDSIFIHNASENNLKSVSLEIPKNKLVVVTGVSGSGKSSLVFDVLYREAESRYLGSFSAHARQFLGKMKHPDVERVENLSPSIAVKQQSVSHNQRSTVGTITGIYDSLRLIYARICNTNRGLFSFNSAEGACSHCKGLGVEDRIDPELLISDPRKTLRQGALTLTTPNGYIIYSQVTMDVLDQVCRAEGFDVDIPWQDLTPEQQHIILYGSQKIEIQYGKHPLESRMRWSGITAKPREMGYYKGIIPVMDNILVRDRNKNILRFVRSENCSVCHGSRLNEKARSFMIHGVPIDVLCTLQLNDLRNLVESWNFNGIDKEIATPVIAHISRKIGIMERLGLGYLSLQRVSGSLSGGEAQRLRLATQANSDLSGMIYVFDEPSIGLHPREVSALIDILKALRDKGNSVLVVEHEEEFIRQADWLIDVGPGPGDSGGEILVNSDTSKLPLLSESVYQRSKTLAFLFGTEKIRHSLPVKKESGILTITGARANNLKNIDVTFLLATLNVVTGVSGAGKSSLVNLTLRNFLSNKLMGTRENVGLYHEISGWEKIGKIIAVDQSPIGRTPRSNPATYTGLFDRIRELFASCREAISKGFDKSRFSFNTPGGRCEACEGAGYQVIGMHFMGSVEVVCETCEGRRFDEETLSIRYQDKNIGDILEMTVEKALRFFKEEPKILHYLETLDNLGLGYLTLGQRSSTLSGGEAQRVKLATELAKTQAEHTLYLLDEPTTGLHQADVIPLLNSLNRLVQQGHTVIVIEHHLGLIGCAGHIIDLGPGSGREGGNMVACGTPAEMMKREESLTGQALKKYQQQTRNTADLPIHDERRDSAPSAIRLTGVTTNNLRNISVVIPHNKITVVTGVSGSGKSSLAFDTIFAEGQNRFLEGFSTYFRAQVGMQEKASFEEIIGLTATFAIDQRSSGHNPRSTVGTLSGIYDAYRLLFSRIGEPGLSEGSPSSAPDIPHPGSSLFSFNHQSGACRTCNGLGFIISCDPLKLITHPDKSLLTGAMDGTKTGKFYGDPHGQYTATLETVGRTLGINFSKSWQSLTDSEKSVALNGTGEKEYQVTWEYLRDNHQGKHQFKGPWPGFLKLVEEEYIRKHADHRGEGLMPIMKQTTCLACNGSRLQPEALRYLVNGVNIAQLSAKSVRSAIGFFKDLNSQISSISSQKLNLDLITEILQKLETLEKLGLSYLTLNRLATTLSGGEHQRIKLAGQLGSGLTGITYILDEPTMGLHARDTRQLIDLLRSLKDAGNTLIIVEHNKDVIVSADHVIDMGPGAGKQGGMIVAEGTPSEIMNHPDSVTGVYLRGKELIKKSHPQKIHTGEQVLTIQNAFANNLKGFDLSLPLGGIIAITGVSGSGKSSLMDEVIRASWENKKATGCHRIEGLDHFQQLVRIHPQTGFNTKLATLVTYTGLLDPIRNLFAALPEAKKQGFGKKHFSFIGKEGRCLSCEGSGKISVSMDFLADVIMECEQCRGKRYRPEILTVLFHAYSIADILEMTVSEAMAFFTNQKEILSRLKVLEQVGLGYLQLGQSLDTLSGGESQRLVLSAELMKTGKGTTLYLFEEPSTGLHFSDIEHLITLFHQLVEMGNTLMVIEHDPMILAEADHLIDLGPDSGEEGGFATATLFV